MIHDTASVTLVARQAARCKLWPRVMVGPPVSIGNFPPLDGPQGHHQPAQADLPGVVYDVCDSLKTHGVNAILILNGHGGNVAPR